MRKSPQKGPSSISETTQPDGQTVYFQPRVVVDDTGGVDVTYFALSRGRVTVMLARATTGAGRFGPPQRISSRPFDPALGRHEGGKSGAWWIGDYQGLAAGGGLIHPFWNDTRTGHLEIFTAAVPAIAAGRPGVGSHHHTAWSGCAATVTNAEKRLH